MNPNCYRLLLILLIFCQHLLLAQSQRTINYQGVARKQNGNVIPETDLNLEITIMEGNPSGRIVYQELHLIHTNRFGIFNIQIGGGRPVDGEFKIINWGKHEHYIQTRIEANSISPEDIYSVTKFNAVPYALYADSCGNPGPQGKQGLAGPKGDQGPEGKPGLTGPKGDPGPEGKQGIQGIRGEQGPEGKQGEQGIPGIPGLDGKQGFQGLQGEQGPQGPEGMQGKTGPQGEPGPEGKPGIPGEKGAQGPEGIQGKTGPQGVPGPQGKQGEPGLKGDQGIPGEKGRQGEQGIQGERGFQGEPGPAGLKGDKGETGAEGKIGPIGPEGKMGPMGPEGNQGISGIQGSPGATGPKGDKGDKGETGIVQAFSASGESPAPTFDTDDYYFVSPVCKVTITDGQKIMVVSNATLGTLFSDARHMNLAIAYKSVRVGAAVEKVGEGVYNLEMKGPSKHLYGLSYVITDLAAGTYYVGLAGSCPSFADKNRWYTEYGYTTVMILAK